MSPLVWVVALFVVGLLVMVLEVFVPSGGVLGFLSVVALGAAIVMAFVEQGPAFGAAVLGVAFLAVPAVLALAFRWFPETPLGRRVIPPPPTPDDVLPAAERRRLVRSLVGKRGRTTTDLLPWGEVEIEGVACEALSEAGPIDRGAAVEAVAVEGLALVVRPVARPEAARPAPPENPDVAGRPATSATLEEFDFDRLDPPAA